MYFKKNPEQFRFVLKSFRYHLEPQQYTEKIIVLIYWFFSLESFIEFMSSRQSQSVKFFYARYIHYKLSITGIITWKEN